MVALARQSAINARQRSSRIPLTPPIEGRHLTGLPARRIQHRLTADEIAELIAAREAGEQINVLAKRFKVDRATVQNYLKRAGVQPRRYTGKTLSPERLKEAGQLYESGLSLRVVSEWFDVDKRYLSKALPEAGFVIRRAGQQKRGPV